MGAGVGAGAAVSGAAESNVVVITMWNSTTASSLIQ